MEGIKEMEEMEETKIEEIELNDEWINNFEKTDKLYEDYYKDDLYYINLKFIYLNRKNEIEKIKQEPFLMTTKNYILREEILGILKKSMNGPTISFQIYRYDDVVEVAVHL